MSQNKIELPTYEEAIKRYNDFEATPLDEFIYQCEPYEKVRKAVFREHLESALYHVIDSQGSFGLTPHAPAEAIQDGFYCCQKCQASQEDTEFCFGCGNPRPS